jgi:hypothetical protein
MVANEVIWVGTKGRLAWDSEEVIVAIEGAGVRPNLKELGTLGSVGFVTTPSLGALSFLILSPCSVTIRLHPNPLPARLVRPNS